MLAVDAELPPFRIDRLDPASMVIWAGLLQDPNPLHLDREAVRKAGLGDRRINQGPANLAYIVNMLHIAFPDARIGDLDIRFMANVLEDDGLTAGGIVTTVEGDRIVCEVWLESDQRGRALSGTATLVRV